MRQKNLDRITTYTGLGASIAGGLAGVGIAPVYTAPIAAIFGGVFSWFTQKPATLEK